MPLRSTRFKFRSISPTFRQRLAFDRKTGKVIEITPYYRKGTEWVKGHSRSLPRRKG